MPRVSDDEVARQCELTRRVGYAGDECDDVWLDLRDCRAALRAVEWFHVPDDPDTAERICPCCLEMERYRHRPDCLIGQALGVSHD
jgi:hypothetical protein